MWLYFTFCTRLYWESEITEKGQQAKKTGLWVQDNHQIQWVRQHQAYEFPGADRRLYKD